MSAPSCRCVGTADVMDKIRVFNALRAELEPQRRHSNRSVLSAANGQPVLVHLEGLMMRAPPVLNSGIVAMLRLSAAVLQQSYLRIQISR